MTFGSWYTRTGRVSRRTYWLHYTLPLAALGLLAALADGALGWPGLLDAQPPQGVVETLGGPLSALVWVFSLIPSVSSTVTRLHDREHSAWWLLWAFVPLVGAIVLLVTVGCLRGDTLPNRYGPPEGWSGDRLGARVDRWA